MLKHLLEMHGEEDHRDIKFRMRVIRYHRNAFERQIHESVAIQNATKHHHLLNSKAEFNRCALPRLGLQLGEQDYKKQREKEMEEREKEEEMERKIKELKRLTRKRKDNNPADTTGRQDGWGNNEPVS